MRSFFAAEEPAAPSTVTDGRHELSYRHLGQHAHSLADDLESQGIATEDGVSLLCSQTVGGAAALIALIGRRQCMALCPGELESSAVPVFCRYLIRAEADGDWPNVEQMRWSVKKNPNWCGQRLGEEGRKLFARTSGTTGQTKLVVHDYGRFLENARNVGDRLGVKATDRIALPLPLHHLYGLGVAFLPALLSGASLDLQSGVNLLRYRDRERVFEPNVAFMTPAFGLTLASRRNKPRWYRMTVMGGDKLPRETFDRYTEQHGTVVQVYGCTEMGAMAGTNPDDAADLRFSTVGAPLKGVSFRLDETTGQLLCRHNYGFEGYADSFGNATPAAAWFETKDRATFDDSGRVSVLGRCDDQVKRDGLLVSLKDVEAAILRIPGLIAAAVVVAGQSGRGTGLVAFCALEHPEKNSDSIVRNAYFEVLPRSAVPDVIRVVAQLPELDSGKVDRLTLLRWAEDGLQSGLFSPALTAGTKAD